MTRVALEGPIARTLLELAWPVLAVLALRCVGPVDKSFHNGPTAIRRTWFSLPSL